MTVKKENEAEEKRKKISALNHTNVMRLVLQST